MTARIFRTLYHAAVYAVGITVLTAAVLVSLVRVLLPDVGLYQNKIEAWVSSYMGLPVVIRSLDADWYGWVPHLYLTDVDLQNRAGTATITTFKSAHVSIDLLRTVRERRIVPRQLTVSGFAVSVTRLPNGGLFVEGVGSESAAMGGADLSEWLFLQQTIRIENATVDWIDRMGAHEPVRLSNVAVTLRSDGERIQIEGEADLPSGYGKRLDIAFDAVGNLLSPDWSGEIYMHATEIAPHNWFRHYRPVDFDTSGGTADIRVWSLWSQAHLVQVEGELQYHGFAAMLGQAALQVDKLDYRFLAERTPGGGWRLDMKLDDFATEHGPWPRSNIRVDMVPLPGRTDYRYEVAFDYLKLDDLAPLASHLEFIPEPVRKRLGELGVSGRLRDGRLTFDPAAPAHFEFDSGFVDLSTHFAGLPQVRNAAGRARGTLDRGTLQFSGEGMEARLPAMKLTRLPFESLRGEVSWRHKDGRWRFETERLDVATPDFEAVLAGSLVLAPGARPIADLRAQMGPADLNRLSAYLPEFQRFKLKPWLQRTVGAGRLVSAAALLKGDLKDFPFDDGSGRFEAIINVEDGLFDYSENWPPVDALAVEVLIDGRTLEAHINSGQVFNAHIQSGKATIADLLPREKQLHIDGTVKGAVRDLSLFVENSPLNNDAMLAGARGALTGGDMELDLDLEIPIRQPEKKAAVSGRLRLDGAELQSGEGRLALQDLAGEVAFTRDSAQGEGLSARFRDHPVEVAISGSKAEGAPEPALLVRGSAAPDFIAAELGRFIPRLAGREEELASRLRGAADFELKVSFSAGEDGTPERRTSLYSDLSGLAIDLPAPLGKLMGESVPLEISQAPGGDSGQQLKVRYGDILTAAIAMDPTGGAPQGAVVRFGTGGPILQTGAGLNLVGRIEELDVAEWWKVLQAHDAGAGAGSAGGNTLTTQLEVGELRIPGQQFENVKLSASRGTAGWELLLDGPDAAGTLRLTPSGPVRPVLEMDLQRLYLKESTPAPGAETARAPDPRLLPGLSAVVEDFRYGSKELGRLELQAAPVDEGLNIKRFQFTKPGLTVSGDGHWLRREEQDESRFRIALEAREIESMLHTFGYTVTPIRDGETTLRIEAGWNGAPHAFTLSNITGTLDLSIRRGQLLEVSPKAGRLFGLLSIQTLPRRLSLDFTDLFGQGLAFDVIEGSFQIENGNAYTNNLTMRGPSANVDITGRTGLAEQDYDQLVTVTPQIADSLPVASVLFGPVGIGVGAFLYLTNQLFSNTNAGIDSLLRYQYTITGSWQNPVIEEYELAAGPSG